MGDSRYSAIVGVVCLGGIFAFVDPLTEDWRPPTPERSAAVSASADSAVTLKGMRIALHELQWENHSLRVSVDLRFVPDTEVQNPRLYWFPLHGWECYVALRFRDVNG